ncbi:MAG TPA: EAL domain-containing protein, partial [Symbiobacteriaceae bacterium]|nr:EAL domain-containing protein [Symbiobacteriaceae bacterium]
MPLLTYFRRHGRLIVLLAVTVWVITVAAAGATQLRADHRRQAEAQVAKLQALSSRYRVLREQLDAEADLTEIAHQIWLGVDEIAEKSGQPEIVVPLRTVVEHFLILADSSSLRSLVEETDSLGAQIGESARAAAATAQFVSTWLLLITGGLVSIVGRRFAQLKSASAKLETERQTIRRSEERFRSIIRNSADLLLIFNAEKEVKYMSPSAEQALIKTPVPKPIDWVVPSDRERVRALYQESQLRPGQNLTAEVRLWLDGEERPFHMILTSLLHDPAVCGTVMTLRDTSERLLFQRALEFHAFHDQMTGLPNRTRFMQQLAETLIRADEGSTTIGVLYLELDNWKIVGDSLGHQVADSLVALVCERLKECLVPGQEAARVGPQALAIIVEKADRRRVSQLAEKILATCQTSFYAMGNELFVQLSLGISLSKPMRSRPESLLREADSALQWARRNTRERFAIFDQRMNAQAVHRLELENDLRRALAREEFFLAYQPVVDLATGRLLELEALVRWAHPRRGIVSPGEFIGVAEETGLIHGLGRWVLQEACNQLTIWQREYPGCENLAVSVNLSPYQFRDPALVEEIGAVLKQTGLEPAHLKLEITESVMAEGTDSVLNAFLRLKGLGVHLAIDDFGTGYSSLGFMQRFPIDTLKVDRTFVQRLGQSDQDAAIVKAIISLGKALDLTVTGEGIEQVEHASFLQEMGCDRGQGYLFGRPLSP